MPLIKIDITAPVGYTSEDIKEQISKKLPILKEEIKEIQKLRETLTVNGEFGIYYRLTVGISLSPEREAGLLKMKKKVSPYSEEMLEIPASKMKSRPVIAGSGPSGLFAALVLSLAGAKPIVIERGLNVDERIKKVNEFIASGRLDGECNIQFGEGGAGTYSDGKLKVGSMDKYKKFILTEFTKAGAPEEILYSSSAHLGTDKLSSIVKNLREKMILLGADFIFGARLSDIKIKNGEVCAAEYIKNGERCVLDTKILILAAGHSARDVFELLYSKGVAMQAKGFGVGMRVEHEREYINRLIYGKVHDSALPTASYRLVTHLECGRSVYSFCMCPGGTVVAATSAEGRSVTNGMSEFSRMADNSNSAILVSVTPEDFGSDSVLAGLDYQEKIERAAFLSAGSDYKAPSMRLSELLSGEKATAGAGVKPSYPRGVSPVGADEYLPSYITDSLREGFLDFDKWLPGFSFPDAVLTGPETRTTSPIRILRNENYSSLSVNGLFPIGEGAGYAGGIISSAADGARCAYRLLSFADL